MTQYLGAIALLVRDYDEAIAYYTGALGFTLVEDTDQGGGKRWAVVAPPGAGETRILLAKAASPEQMARVGDQTGGRVSSFSTPTISGVTIAPISRVACAFSKRRATNPMARWRFSRTSMAIDGTCCSSRGERPPPQSK